MTAAARPLPEREREAETAAIKKRELALAQRAVEGPKANLPRAIWEARAAYTFAQMERQDAEDDVRDAELAWRELRVTDELTMKARTECKVVLDMARKRLRTLVYCEGLALATLESVKAAVELTTGGRR